jgi:hypothetical protein
MRLRCSGNPAAAIGGREAGMSATDRADTGNLTQDDKTQDVYDYDNGLEDGHETDTDPEL